VGTYFQGHFSWPNGKCERKFCGHQGQIKMAPQPLTSLALAYVKPCIIAKFMVTVQLAQVLVYILFAI
jgi:hypothetical protein